VIERSRLSSLTWNVHRWPLTVTLLLLFSSLVVPAGANPYLAKSGEAPVTLYIASCAVTGGFTHLYVALDYDLFAKYGLNVKHFERKACGDPRGHEHLYCSTKRR